MDRKQFAYGVLLTGWLFGSALTYAHFDNVTHKLNIKFTHTNGAFRHKDNSHSRYMPESMGSGVVIFDYDGDRDNDILFINSTTFRDSPTSIGSTMSLLENKGKWEFTDVTQQVNLNIPLYGMGGAAADFDGDNDIDLLIATYGGIELLENQNGKFRQTTRERGLAQPDKNTTSFPKWSTGAVFFDADGDLDLDIVVINYVHWTIETDIYVSYDLKNKGYASPKMYKGQALQLFLQDENHNFKDATHIAGFDTLGKSLGVSLWDFNQDNLLDIVVANDTTENFLYKNLGNGKFTEIGIETGVAYDRNGNTRAGMGIDIADINNDNQAAIAIGNFSGEPTSFFRQHSTWRFSEDSELVNVAKPSTPLLTFGLKMDDFDLDGWQDLIMTNGHVEPSIQNAFPNERYEQPILLLKNTGASTFSPWQVDNPALSTPMVGRGLAVSDLDDDGDLDVVISGNKQEPRLLKNTITGKQFLRVSLIGNKPNTDAIGATIYLIGNKITQKRIVRTGGSYISQSEMSQTFGIPNGEQIKTLKIIWPDGTTSQIKTPKINTHLKIQQANGI